MYTHQDFPFSNTNSPLSLCMLAQEQEDSYHQLRYVLCFCHMRKSECSHTVSNLPKKMIKIHVGLTEKRKINPFFLLHFFFVGNCDDFPHVENLIGGNISSGNWSYCNFSHYQIIIFQTSISSSEIVEEKTQLSA